MAGFAAIASPSAASAAESGRVTMVDNDPDLTNWHFDPAEITVPPGGTVVWVNQGKEDHTVTADDGSFDSGYKKRGTSFQRAFPRTGRYSYHCAPHPWMKGTVIVAAGAPPATSAAAGVADTASTTTAPASAASSTTLPASLAAPTTAPADTATSAPAETTTPTTGGSDDEASAEPAASRKRSVGHLAGTLAVVVLPTLGGLAIGAKLRRRNPEIPRMVSGGHREANL
ncbi:MAG: cupredoxin domain-containing protein [Actinobacteria bacterium]|nr:cupredoxin domain-containing protein [Actinomycetota bacterium]